MILKFVFFILWISLFCVPSYAENAFSCLSRNLDVLAEKPDLFEKQTVAFYGKSFDKKSKVNYTNEIIETNDNESLFDRLMEKKQSDYGQIDFKLVEAISGKEKFNEFKDAVEKNSPWLLIEIGNFCYRSGEISKAENVYLSGLFNYWTDKDFYCLLTALNNIGLCKLEKNQNIEALNIFRVTLYWSTQFNLKEYIVLAKLYISDAYAGLGKVKASLDEIEQVEKKLSSSDRQGLRIFVKCQTGKILERSGEKTEAIRLYERIADSSQTLDESSYVETLVHLAGLHLENGDHDKALKYALIAENYCCDNLSFLDKMQLYNLVFEIYHRAGKSELALKYFIKSENVKDSYYCKSLDGWSLDLFNKLEMNHLRYQKQNSELEFCKERIHHKYQNRLNLFLVFSTVSLVLMMFFMRGFDAKISLFFDCYDALTSKKKIVYSLMLLFYFVFFYYSFLPAMRLHFIPVCPVWKRLLAGLYVFAVTFSLVSFSYGYYKNIPNCDKSRFFYVVSVMPFFVVIASFMLITINNSEFTLNNLLSLSLFVFASYMFPFFILFLISEKMIFTKYNYMVEMANCDLRAISLNQSKGDDVAVIKSERTNASLEVCINDFIAAEAQGNYCMFYIRKNDGGMQRRVIHVSLKSLIQQLSAHHCVVRCHKSFVVNLNRVKEIRGNSRGYVFYFSDEVDPIPISRNYQKSVIDSIKKVRDVLLNN